MVQSLTTISSVNSMNVYAIDSSNSAFNKTPLSALSSRTRQQLALMLNSKKVLRSEVGYQRDWRGIAALSQQKNYFDENALKFNDNPIEKVLQFWCKNNPETAKVGFLEQYLGIIDRWDVCDDIHENLEKDTEAYNTKEQQKLIALSTQQTATNYSNGAESDDVYCAPDHKYDAFVLYAAADMEYAIELARMLEEETRYNFKLYLKDRDFEAGVMFEHVELTRLIEDRCKHLIVILTEDFLQSPENNFFVNYTQALQIQNNARKIIPLIYKPNMIIPKTLQIYTHLRYNTNANGLFNFWDKLAKSLKNIDVIPPPCSYVRDLHVPTAPPALEETQSVQMQLAALPPTPSISINGEPYLLPEPNDKLKKNQRYLKRSSFYNTVSGDPVCLRNAHSMGGLNITDSPRPRTTSVSTMSTTSETKRKKKWPKRLKNFFSGSSSKLQEPA